MNKQEIADRADRVKNFTSIEKHFESGAEAGSLFNFVFLHDFVAPNQTFFKFFKTQKYAALPNNVTNYTDFAKGFVNGTSVLTAIPSLQQCETTSEKIEGNFVEFIYVLKNTTLSNLAESIKKAANLVGDIVNEFQDTIPKCQTAANETQVLVGKLGDHVSKDGYATGVVTHAMTNVLEVMSRTNKIQDHFKNFRHFDAGVESGSFFNFIFLHDFHL